MDDNITISKALQSDLEEILSLQKKAFISEAELYNDFSIEPLRQTLESIQDDYNHYLFLKAECRDKIVGSVKARDTGEFCWVGKLMVDPEFQSRGIGRKLMQQIEREFPSAKQFVLGTGSKSLKNINFYESLGYCTVEVFEDEKNAGLSLVKMAKLNNPGN